MRLLLVQEITFYKSRLCLPYLTHIETLERIVDSTPSKRISVILPVYNGQAYLHDAVQSILDQTSDEWEMIIIDDGSSDASTAYLQNLSDPRVRWIRQENRGLPAALNRAISMASGDYLARQDQDDISFPPRLQKQAAFLDAHPDVGMVGAHAVIWEVNKETDRLHEHPTNDATIKFSLLFNNPFVHSSVMIRRSVIEEVGSYSEDKSRQPPEDYELWSRVARKFKLANIPEVLIAYREVPGSMSRTGLNPFLTRLIRITAENIAWASGRPVDLPEVVAISRFTHGVYEDIPRGISFAKMKVILNNAAMNIAHESGVAPSELGALLQTRQNIVRYQYWEYRSGGLIGKITKSRIGNYAKNVAKRISKGSHL
jgi:glycosyltransferase involved in cell wall biosynthesis